MSKKCKVFTVWDSCSDTKWYKVPLLMLEMIPRNRKVVTQKKVELFDVRQIEIYSYNWPLFQDKQIQGKDYY